MPRDRARRGILTLAAMVVVIAGVREAASIAVPILLAFFLAFVSSPVAFRLSRSMPYGLAVTIVLLVELTVLVGLGVLVGGSAAQFRERAPVYGERLGALYVETAEWLGAHGVPMNISRIPEDFDAGWAMGMIGDTVTSLGSIIGDSVIVALVLAFALFDAARLWRKVDAHFAERSEDAVLGGISREVNRYLSVKTSVSVATGLALGLWCALMGVDFPVVWGLLAFLLNYIPTIGSILAAIPPTLLALVVLGPWPALLVVLGYLAVNFLVGNVLEPRLLGRALGMSSVVVLLSIVVWGWVLGPVGALLSVPLTMIVKIVLARTEEWAWLADLMSGPGQPERAPARSVPTPPVVNEDEPTQT